MRDFTLQERAFTKLFALAFPVNVSRGMRDRDFLHKRLDETRQERYEKYSAIALWIPSINGATLHPSLQDLANILAVEADDAFYADYYPRLPDVDVPEDHVRRVMEALQREMDREANRRHKMPVVFENLPWERQCALAERRRYWYAQYGVTPENWQERGTWSLWEVNSELMVPEEVRRLYE